MIAKVMLAWPTAGKVDNGFTMSVAGTLLRGSAIVEVRSVVSGPRIAEARNQIVDQFASSDCDWLWMVDTDMVFAPDALERLLAAADADSQPIVGGLCLTGDGLPTMFRFTSEALDSERVTAWDAGAVVKVDTTGAACLLVHRGVFAAMKAKYGTLAGGAENPYPWFVEGSVDRAGHVYGEDTAFLLRARGLGIPVVVHTGVKVGHVKSHMVGEVA